MWMRLLVVLLLSITSNQVLARTLSEECSGYLPEDCREYGDCKTCWDGSRLDCFPSESSQLYGGFYPLILQIWAFHNACRPPHRCVCGCKTQLSLSGIQSCEPRNLRCTISTRICRWWSAGCKPHKLAIRLASDLVSNLDQSTWALPVR